MTRRNVPHVGHFGSRVQGWESGLNLYGMMSFPGCGTRYTERNDGARLEVACGNEGIAGSRSVEVGDGEATGGESTDGGSLEVGGSRLGESQAAGAEVGSVPGDRARPSGGVSGADVATAVRRGSGGGLPGQLQWVRDYVRSLRRAAPPPPARRFETPPGHQGQVDFGTFRTPWGRRHALVVLGTRG